MSFLWAFLIGGIICAIGQLLIDFTKMTPARILVLFVCAGAFLTLIGVYEPVVKLAGAGATVPICGFGYSLAKGTINAVSRFGLSGIFTGGLSATAGGIAAVIVFAFVFAVIFKPKEKNL